MLILSDLLAANQITRKINAMWQQSWKEFHLAFPYAPWRTYDTEFYPPSQNTNKA
jgi:hypothetical protein